MTGCLMLLTGRRVVAIVISVIVGVGFISTGSDPLIGDNPFDLTLDRMSDQQIREYVQQHPARVTKIANADPGEMAELWKSLPDTEKTLLAYALPHKIGNLDGIDFTTRNKANRRHLRTDLSAAREAAAKTHSPVAKLRLASLRAIEKALLAPSQPRRYLVALSDDVPALAAISVGNLDTAKLVTFAVPGMGTYTTDMQLWAQAAQNIYEEQGEAGAPREHAVVAWINYQAPPQGLDAARGLYATLGAPRLAADIAGVSAARPKPNSPTVNVVAHSYGTTMAADALASDDLGVYAFVMIGSAGIEPAVGTASSLGAKHVYAAEASGDSLARLGRVSRIDPREPGFGATVFNVDGVDDDPDLIGVTGHEPILHSRWNDNRHSSVWKSTSRAQSHQKFFEHMRRHGYLDQDTQSLHNVAVLTTPGATMSVR